ncbi:MAG: hypothetical protein M1814_006745 [Vezdaea aestivalis]|nr:MAG: hypothetical protein M1814_006745 [Vezdaea aestivalis]
MGLFNRSARQHGPPPLHDYEAGPMPTQPTEKSKHGPHHHNIGLPGFNHNGHKVTKGINPEGESGRRGVDPLHFFRIVWRSSCTASKWVNILWPFVPAAIAIHFARPDLHLWIFILNYIAIAPSANLIGFAGQELARKMPKVLGVVVETTLGSIVEIVLFMILLANDEHGELVFVIQSAILGSILANLLLCLGLCFFFGGARSGRKEQEFDEAISEVGSGLLLVAGMGLLVPSAFFTALQNTPDLVSMDKLQQKELTLSRITAIILLAAFAMYVFFQVRTHHGVYSDILEKDELKDADREKDLRKSKLTLTECIIALVLALTLVSMSAVFLVQNIEYIVIEHHVPDHFLGLILVPLVEKFSEHITAIDEAWDDQMNFALAHVLGATIQTALLNAPLVVLVGWGLHKGMSLNFEIFNVLLVVLAILVVGNFLRDGKSNYLEGGLCVLVYLIIATTSAFYPNPPHGKKEESGGSGGGHKF